MTDPLAALGRPVLFLLGQSVSVLLIVAAVAIAVRFLGLARRAGWNWPLGAAIALVLAVTWASAGRYTDAAFAALLAVLDICGWWMSRRGVAVHRATPRQSAYAVVLTAIATVVAAYLLAWQSDGAVLLPQAFLMTAAVLASVAQVRAVVDAWGVWCVVGVVSALLAAASGEWLSAALEVVFVAIAVSGLRRWILVRRRACVISRAPAPAWSSAAPGARDH